MTNRGPVGSEYTQRVSQTVLFPARFNGPPESANGGYSCGVIAQQVPSDLVEVTLRRPPPLDRPLVVGRTGEKYSVLDDGELVATAGPADEPVFPDPPVFEIPDGAPFGIPQDTHPFPTCFTCGPARSPGDGLRIFAKHLPEQELLADWWTPDASLAADDGSVPKEIVWAALDCPGGSAAFARIPGGVALLGRMEAHVRRTPHVDEPCVVVASSRWHDGRKIDAHSALYTREGELLGAARSVWVDVTPLPSSAQQT